jgi:hypothetical protein
MATLIDVDGHLAIDMEWLDGWHEPEQSRTVYVGKMKSADWEQLLGRPVSFTNGNTGTVHADGRTYYLQTDDPQTWTRKTETRPIPKPRKSKGKEWKWNNGRWHAVWVKRED